MVKNRYSKLLGNSLLFAVANLGTKVMQFLMVPLYTYALTTKQYGVVDLLLTTVTMMTPIISLSVFDAVFRFSMDRDADLTSVFSNGVFIAVVGTIVILIVSPINLILKVPYFGYFLIMLIISAVNSLLQNFARATGYVKQFAFSGMINAAMLILLNIVFLVVIKLGIIGYIYGIVISGITTTVFLTFSTRIWRYFSLWSITAKYSKKMLSYSLPLIPNAFSWWFTNDANKYFILFFVGAAGNGLYAVANKIPSILTLFFSIFTQAWQLSAVEEFDSKDNGKFYSNIFNSMVFISMMGIGALLVILKPFMRIYTSPSFYSSWHFVPFLLLAAIYSNISGFIGTIFIAAKKTRLIFTTTVVGMVINLIFNLILIPMLGVNGAGIGSAVGFVVVCILRFIESRKFVPMTIDKRLIYSTHVIVGLMILIEIIVPTELLTVVSELVLFLLLVVFERKILVNAIELAVKSLRVRRS